MDANGASARAGTISAGGQTHREPGRGQLQFFVEPDQRQSRLGRSGAWCDRRGGVQLDGNHQLQLIHTSVSGSATVAPPIRSMLPLPPVRARHGRGGRPDFHGESGRRRRLQLYSIRFSASFAASGGSGSVGVTTTAGCVWTSSGAGWITITPGSTGSGAVQLGIRSRRTPNRVAVSYHDDFADLYA